MIRCTRSVICLAALLVCVSFLKAQSAPKTDTSPHTVQMIQVEPDVKLEVLDWGGTDRPLILLQGLGGVAHDQFAQGKQPFGAVLVIRNADHQIVRTNEADVVRPMQVFLSSLH